MNRTTKYTCILAAAATLVLLPEAAHAADGGLEAQGAFSSNGFAGGVFIDAICDLMGLVGGSLGGMLTTAAVVTGLVTATVGSFQNVKAAVVVAVGAFAISAGVSVYFGDFGCDGGGQSGRTAVAAPAPDIFDAD